MYSVPAYRIRAYVRARKLREQTTLSQRKDSIFLKKSVAEIAIPDNPLRTGLGSAHRRVIPASVILNDFSPRGIFLFSANSLPIGQRVTLTVHGPKHFFVKGRVAFCKRFSLDSAVLTEGGSFPYRMGILFDFQSIDERIAVKKYYDELSTRYLRTPQCL